MPEGLLRFYPLQGTETFRRQRGCGSVGRASPCQGEGRGFESRHPLGRLAQRERASLTRKRSLVRSQYRPPVSRILWSGFFVYVALVDYRRELFRPYPVDGGLVVWRWEEGRSVLGLRFALPFPERLVSLSDVCGYCSLIGRHARITNFVRF